MAMLLMQFEGNKHAVTRAQSVGEIYSTRFDPLVGHGTVLHLDRSSPRPADYCGTLWIYGAVEKNGTCRCKAMIWAELTSELLLFYLQTSGGHVE
jgi:hypothetical protein